MQFEPSLLASFPRAQALAATNGTNSLQDGTFGALIRLLPPLTAAPPQARRRDGKRGYSSVQKLPA